MNIFLSLLLFSTANSADFAVMAHRGVYQTFPRPVTDPEACTAKMIYPPTHGFLENTIPSMREAFRLGADMVEIDLQATSDGKVVVFHDWRLECRTEAEGVTESQSFEFLRGLDIGHGYTYMVDGKPVNPFRCSLGDEGCRKTHQMPTLREIFRLFPEGNLCSI